MKLLGSDARMRRIGAGCSGVVTLHERTNSTITADESWSEGSRSTYRFVDARTGATRTPERVGTAPIPFGVCSVYQLEPGLACVEHSIFRGKDMPPRVYFHGADRDYFRRACDLHADCRADRELALACDGKPGDRTTETLRALALRSPYKGETLRKLGVLSQELDTLVSEGFASRNRAGLYQLTTKGRLYT